MLIFLLISMILITLIFALGVVFSQQLVYSLFFLILTFLTTAVIWVLLNNEFLGLILIIIYVGAVMTLFLFVMMLVQREPLTFSIKHLFHAVLLGILFILALFFAIDLKFKSMKNIVIDINNLLATLGNHHSAMKISYALYTHNLIPLELAGILLLVGLISTILLTQEVNNINNVNKSNKRQRQDIAKQINTTKKERLRIISK